MPRYARIPSVLTRSHACVCGVSYGTACSLVDSRPAVPPSSSSIGNRTAQGPSGNSSSCRYTRGYHRCSHVRMRVCVVCRMVPLVRSSTLVLQFHRRHRRLVTALRKVRLATHPHAEIRADTVGAHTFACVCVWCVVWYRLFARRLSSCSSTVVIVDW